MSLFTFISGFMEVKGFMEEIRIVLFIFGSLYFSTYGGDGNGIDYL